VPRDEPIPLGDALATLGRQLGLPTANGFDIATTCWSEVAGPELAAHSRVRSVHDGACTIEVDEPGWATRARYLTGELRELANSRAEAPFVTAVNVIVSGPGRAV
jgi:predicted nucleic acid-binding Zn ribbon protein